MPRKRVRRCPTCGKSMRRLTSVWACESCEEFRFLDDPENGGK